MRSPCRDDGSTIVGYTNKSTLTLPGGTVVPAEPQAVRWTGAGFTTLEQLGSFPGAAATDSRALAVSPDGAIVVGAAADANLSDRAFIWDASNGMRSLKTVLTDEYGPRPDGLGALRGEAAISDVVAGEFTVAGRGMNPAG